MLACFGLSPAARAVKPPPDGGYVGNNTAEGDAALLGLTTGLNNTAIGFHALNSNRTGDDNTATGSLALHVNNGTANTALGFEALYSNTIGAPNTATGAFALHQNQDGANNVATGYNALYHNTSGNNNTAIGLDALLNNTDGSENAATGFLALFSNNGSDNTANGSHALYNNNMGNNNTAVGFHALYNNIEGNENTAVGVQALFNNAFNPPLYDGQDNTAVGFQALYNNIEGTYNIALGAHAGDALNFFSYWNIDIGNEGVAGDGNTIRIGTPAQPGGWFEPGNGGPSGQSRTFIAGIRGVTTGNDDAIPVVIDSAGQLGTVSSSRRFKTEIKPMDKTSEAILTLKPVTFYYKSQKNNVTGRPQFGLIAEDVAKVNSDLVVRDENGKIYTVRYDAVNAMLLNEFIKEHRTVEELKSTVAKQEAIIAKQQEGIDALTAAVKEQISQMQKVSAQLEVSKPTQQMAVNDQ
jgi:uncharacterized coiled-coil protein SlyX